MDAYALIRAHNPNTWVIYNELYEENFPLWLPHLDDQGHINQVDASSVQLTEEFDYVNVVLDIHLYNWQEPFVYMNESEHAAVIAQWTGLIDSLTPYYNIIIGEWCFSSGRIKEWGYTFIQNQLNVFRNIPYRPPVGSNGWYIWSWKIDPVARLNPVFLYWDVQYTLAQKSDIVVLLNKYI